MLQAKTRGKRGFKFVGIAACRKPHVQRRVEQAAQVIRVENLAGAGDIGLPRHECLSALVFGEERVPKRQNLLAQGDLGLFLRHQHLGAAISGCATKAIAYARRITSTSLKSV